MSGKIIEITPQGIITREKLVKEQKENTQKADILLNCLTAFEHMTKEKETGDDLKAMAVKVAKISINGKSYEVLMAFNPVVVKPKLKQDLCLTCKHDSSSVCLDCDPNNKEKGYEPKIDPLDKIV